MNAAPTASLDDFRGWQAALLRNDYVRLAVVPAIGGRVMAYDLGAHPFLFVDPDLAGRLFTPEENQGDGTLGAWKNYGGDKTWPAPQGWERDDQWHGPPDPILDTGRYTLDTLHAEAGEAVAVVTSPPDLRTGIQITRRLTLGRASSRVRLDIRFHNHSDRPVRWSIWDVVQLRADAENVDGTRTYDQNAIITVPINPRSVFPGGFAVMFGADDNPQWQTLPVENGGLLTVPYLWEIGKVGLDSPAGWIAFAAGGCAFVEQFEYFPGAAYPDGGASVEIWTVGAGQVANLNYEDSGIYLMETEILSPLYTLAPGDHADFSITWGACQIAGPVVDVTAAGAICSALRGIRDADGWTTVTFDGGVFDAGTLALRWLDAAGLVVTETALGEVDPLTRVSVDRSARLPTGAIGLSLVVTTLDGRETELAAAVIEDAHRRQ